MSNRSAMPPESLSGSLVEDKAVVVEPVKKVSSGIKVMALRQGFFANERKVEGDEFEVSSMDKLGSWMKCLDPKVDLLHQKLMKDKKKPAGI